MALTATICCFVLYWLGYRYYAGYLSRRVFSLSREAATPAHTMRDDVDYLPTNPYVLFGHHYASITGLSPMLGPAIAVIWGWLPGMLWVVLGALLVGCVHDFAALVMSMRARGLSVGAITEGIVGQRAKTLFHLIIFFGIALAMGVFVSVIATLFTPQYYPQAIFPSFALMAIAVGVGTAVYRGGASASRAALVGFILTLLAVAASALTDRLSPAWGSRDGWGVVLLAYSFLASVLPVWVLLQPRDFINSLLLYLGMIAMYGGFAVLRPDFVSPAVVLAPPGAPPLFPFVFVVIACGAVSGFHGLVSSGTTAKQIDREDDARMIGYGGMIGESLLGLMAVLACTAGFRTAADWNTHYASWGAANTLGGKISVFIEGTARFVSALGVPHALATAFIAVVVVSFALTTLDSATRLLRYNISEIGATLGFERENRYLTSALAVLVIGFFAFYRVDGKPVGLALWKLFGTTNQLLAGLTLVVASVYLYQRGRNHWVTSLPAAAMMITTISAMVRNLAGFWGARQWLLFALGLALLVLAVGILIEGGRALAAARRVPRKASLEVFAPAESQTS
ncbi:MAG: carbon starvation protein A [Candidatus Dadabacteria bacterium]|nr:MAG: carbon starvation protein A [Candidatus Dadabacteria bacterium]